jgi:hypothetical protein
MVLPQVKAAHGGRFSARSKQPCACWGAAGGAAGLETSAAGGSPFAQAQNIMAEAKVNKTYFFIFYPRILI